MPERVQARRPRAEHARSRQRSLQPGAAAADPVADGVRGQSDGVDAESGSDSRRAPARGPVHRRARPVRHRHRALRRLRAARDEPDRASGPVARVGASVSRAESPGDRAARRVGVEHRAVPAAGAGARPDRGVALRERRVDAASGAGERAPVARRDHLRAAVGRGLRAVALPGRLAAVCATAASRRGRERRSSISEPLHEQGHDPLPWAGEIRVERGPAAHHRQVAALPELRIQQSWSVTGAAPASCSSRSTRTTRGRGAWRPATRCACGTSAAKCAPSARCRTACARAWPGCRSAGSPMRAARGGR